MTLPTVRLYTEDFSAREGRGRLIGEFPTAREARNAAEERVQEDLNHYYRDKQTAQSQLDQWMLFGEDVFIIPQDTNAPFSAMEFARKVLGL